MPRDLSFSLITQKATLQINFLLSKHRSRNRKCPIWKFVFLFSYLSFDSKSFAWLPASNECQTSISDWLWTSEKKPSSLFAIFFNKRFFFLLQTSNFFKQPNLIWNRRSLDVTIFATFLTLQNLNYNDRSWTISFCL